MRLQVFSDVHFDVATSFEPHLHPDADAVVVAGDLCEGIEQGMAWLRRHLGPVIPIVMVPGNHEFYHRVRADERRAGLIAAATHNVTLLDDAVAEIGGVRFVGSTLWCDFDLFGVDLRARVMAAAERLMLDHRHIVEDAHSGRWFSAQDARQQHGRSRQFVEDAVAQPFDGPTVIVTHHGIHEKSVAQQYREDLLTPAFISDLSAVIERCQPRLWIHGHTHVSFDYRVGGTRIVCNPHGYGYERENPGFNPGLIVDI